MVLMNSVVALLYLEELIYMKVTETVTTIFWQWHFCCFCLAN